MEGLAVQDAPSGILAPSSEQSYGVDDVVVSSQRSRRPGTDLSYSAFQQTGYIGQDYTYPFPQQASYGLYGHTQSPYVPQRTTNPSARAPDERANAFETIGEQRVREAIQLEQQRARDAQEKSAEQPSTDQGRASEASRYRDPRTSDEEDDSLRSKSPDAVRPTRAVKRLDKDLNRLTKTVDSAKRQRIAPKKLRFKMVRMRMELIACIDMTKLVFVVVGLWYASKRGSRACFIALAWFGMLYCLHYN